MEEELEKEYWPNCECRMYSKDNEKTKKKWQEIQLLCQRLQLGIKKRKLEIQSLRLRHKKRKAEGATTAELLEIVRELKRISNMNIRDYVAEKGHVNSGGGRRRRTRRRRTRRKRRTRRTRRTRRKSRRRRRRR